MNSTESQTNSTETQDPNWRERLQERWSVALGKRKMLGYLVGWESIRRGMKQEDDLRCRDMVAHHNRLQGDEMVAGEVDDEMGHIALGDISENHHHHYHQPPQPKPNPLAKAALYSALVASGGGLAAGTGYVLDKLKEQPEPRVDVIEQPGETEVRERHSSERVRIGEPIVRPPQDE